MNKSEEIMLLRDLALRLGANSYCGPWLASVADEVEQQVRGDFFPTPTIAGTTRACQNMIIAAAASARQIEADARVKSERMHKAIEASISSIKDRAAIKLRLALNELEGRL